MAVTFSLDHSFCCKAANNALENAARQIEHKEPKAPEWELVAAAWGIAAILTDISVALEYISSNQPHQTDTRE